ncbi:unnamed protein product, partial [Hapterophycus canaliculatus]
FKSGCKTGRSTMVVRAKCSVEEMKGNRSRIIISEIPYQQYRDRIV